MPPNAYRRHAQSCTDVHRHASPRIAVSTVTPPPCAVTPPPTVTIHAATAPTTFAAFCTSQTTSAFSNGCGPRHSRTTLRLGSPPLSRSEAIQDTNGTICVPNRIHFRKRWRSRTRNRPLGPSSGSSRPSRQAESPAYSPVGGVSRRQGDKVTKAAKAAKTAANRLNPPWSGSSSRPRSSASACSAGSPRRRPGRSRWRRCWPRGTRDGSCRTCRAR